MLMKELNIKECSYIRIDEDEEINNDSIIPLNISNPLNYYIDAPIEFELDDEIVDLMKPYEQLCMDIINRWHKSYVYNSDYKEIKNLYFIFLRYWNDYIIKHAVNLMIVNIMPHMIDEFIPYAICRARSIPTIIQGVIPFTKGEKGNYILRPAHDLFDINICDRYKALKEKYTDSSEEIYLNPEIRRYFEQYDSKSKTDQKVVFLNEKNSFTDKILNYKKHAQKYLYRKDFRVLINKAWYMLRVRLETSKFLKKISKLEEDADKSKKFFLFCLHLQPEATTTPAGGNYADQLMAIRLLSKNLPDNVYLYVKEHPAYWSQKDRIESVYESRSEQFYQQIKMLRNVRLIDHTIPSGDLLNNCAAVVTVTGTVGFEALFKGIPVITFGATFYEIYPTVYRVKTDADCRNAIEAVLSQDQSFSLRELEIFLSAVQKYIVPLGMFEKNFLDNGSPAISDEDKIHLVEKLVEFYREYYC